MKEKPKSIKGITLIALVITIIVMLILVAVSVTVALQGGLFTTAKTATRGTQVENDKERILSDYYAYKAQRENGEETSLSIADATELTGDETSGWTMTLKNGNKYTLSKDGDLQYVDPNKKVVSLIPTEEESDDLYNYSGMLLVASSNNDSFFSGQYQVLVLQDSWGEGSIVPYIYISNGEWGELNNFVYIPNETTANACESMLSKKNVDMDIQVGKWYRMSDAGNPYDAVLYTDASPISLSDFENGLVFSESYLQKVIDSFDQ